MIIKVRLVKKLQDSYLVEYLYNDGLKRCYIPQNQYSDEVELDVLEMGIPYGDEFTVPDITIRSDVLLNELHRRGIWTKEDVIENADTANAAIRYLVNLTVHNLFKEE